MKKILFSLALNGVIFGSMLMMGFAPPAFAGGDSFEINKDGRTYLCSAEGSTTPPPSSGGAIDCVTAAYNGAFSRDEAMQLCSGARSVAPASCAAKAYAGPLSKTQAISLCTRATSNGPVECVIAAYSGPFSKEESLSLCTRNGRLETAQCAIRAYAGPYTKQQALQLCQNNPHLLNLALTSLHDEKLVGFSQVLNKANQKAIQRNELNVTNIFAQ